MKTRRISLAHPVPEYPDREPIANDIVYFANGPALPINESTNALTPMAHIHVIDDREDFCFAFVSMVNRMGYSCEASHSFGEGLRRLREQPGELVFLDVHLPEGDTLSHLHEITRTPGTPDVVVVTANGNSEAADTAIRSGAWDYLIKPVSYPTLEQIIKRCLRHREARRDFMQKAAIERGPLIGESAPFEEVLQKLGMISRTPGNVLIVGETGTGKELLARALHANSDRADKNFIVVDCTNLPTSLAESILFGHARGAYTDAREASVGLFKQADGGTIFLDEVGDLDLGIQKSLLRVLQDRSFRPLKSAKEESSDFRLVAATNRDLEQMVQSGEFRKDLYYRLTTNVIELPPLRHRPDDVEPLVRHFVERICAEQGSAPKHIAKDFLHALEQYPWPGNVRDVINVVHTAIANSFDVDTLHSHHLPRDVRAFLIRNAVQEPTGFSLSGANGSCGRSTSEPETTGAPAMSVAPFIQEAILRESTFPSLRLVRKKVLDQMETEYLNSLLTRSEHDVATACSLSGLSRARLYELLQKHGFTMKR